MKGQTDKGMSRQLNKINLTLNKTNEKLDRLADLLLKMIKDNIKIHNNLQ